MRVRILFRFAALAPFCVCHLLPQSVPRHQTPAPRASSAVPAQLLAMPPTAARAFEKGSTLLVEHEFQASLVYFQKAVELAPTFFPPYHNLAVAQYDLGRFDDAAKNFEKAIELSKGSYAPSFFSLAMIFYDRAQFAEAQRIVQQGLLIAPSSGIGKYCLGLTEYSLGNTADAQRSALEALRIDPHINDAYLLLAHVHERLHDPNAVVADVDAFLKQVSANEVRADALALLKRAQRDLARGPESAK